MRGRKSVMINIKRFVAMLAVMSVLGPVTGFAASADRYQVTGEVLEISDTMIVVEKEGNRWEIKRDESTKGDTKVKVGDKVTVYYRMTAAEIEAK